MEAVVWVAIAGIATTIVSTLGAVVVAMVNSKRERGNSAEAAADEAKREADEANARAMQQRLILRDERLAHRDEQIRGLRDDLEECLAENNRLRADRS